MEEAEELDESKQKNEQNYENYNNYQSEKRRTIDFTKTVKRNHQFKELGERNYEISGRIVYGYRIYGLEQNNDIYGFEHNNDIYSNNELVKLEKLNEFIQINKKLKTKHQLKEEEELDKL